MAFRHYYWFDTEIGRKIDKAGWDILREEDKSGAFSIEPSVEQYEKNCESAHGYNMWARKILELKGISNKLFSIGCGKGILEWNLKKIVGDTVNLTVSDYASNGLERLKRVFTNCDNFCLFDMLGEDYSAIDKGATVIIFRCTTEITIRQFKYVFKKLSERGIEKVVFVPTEIISFKEGLRRYKVYLREIIKGGAETNVLRL